MDTVVDIVKLAIANEVKARAYYEKASELTSEGESLMVFIELVEMEATHARRLVDAFGTTLQNAGVDAEQYLAQLESNSGQVLSEAEVRLLEDADMRQVIDFAINMERMARDAYLDLAGKVETPTLRQLCESLAQEEQQHHDVLSEARSGVDTPIDERPAL
jgi:rubrerythrin